MNAALCTSSSFAAGSTSCLRRNPPPRMPSGGAECVSTDCRATSSSASHLPIRWGRIDKAAAPRSRGRHAVGSRAAGPAGSLRKCSPRPPRARTPTLSALAPCARAGASSLTRWSPGRRLPAALGRRASGAPRAAGGARARRERRRRRASQEGARRRARGGHARAPRGASRWRRARGANGAPHPPRSKSATRPSPTTSAPSPTGAARRLPTSTKSGSCAGPRASAPTTAPQALGRRACSRT